MRKQSDCVTEYLALLSACRPFDLLPCWALEWAAPELWLWDAAWRPTPESCWPTPSYWLPCRPLRKEEKYQLAHYKHSCMHIFVREWPEAVFKHVKTHNPVRLNSPPAWSLLIVGDGGSHGRVGHHGLAGVVDGHAGHLLPRGRDEDLLCACWPALLFTHTHKPINTCLNTTVRQLSQERREQSVDQCGIKAGAVFWENQFEKTWKRHDEHMQFAD